VIDQHLSDTIRLHGHGFCGLDLLDCAVEIRSHELWDAEFCLQNTVWAFDAVPNSSTLNIVDAIDILPASGGLLVAI
jgi:hypothetical protein